MFGYSHFTGGFAGGQAEYVRVPYGDVNLLKLPSDIPDEKGLYLSDVLCTSWNAVVDTGVQKGDVVAIWGAGPIGQMAADFAFINGASRVIMIDSNCRVFFLISDGFMFPETKPHLFQNNQNQTVTDFSLGRLDYVKSKYPKVETLDYSTLPRGTTVSAKLSEMVERGPDVAIECVAGEYAKGWAHYFELMLGMETDTSEIVNEMITSVKNFGRCGITGVYVGYVSLIY